jgi:hypothetical protein
VSRPSPPNRWGMPAQRVADPTVRARRPRIRISVASSYGSSPRIHASRHRIAASRHSIGASRKSIAAPRAVSEVGRNATEVNRTGTEQSHKDQCSDVAAGSADASRQSVDRSADSMDVTPRFTLSKRPASLSALDPGEEGLIHEMPSDDGADALPTRTLPLPASACSQSSGGNALFAGLGCSLFIGSIAPVPASAMTHAIHGCRHTNDEGARPRVSPLHL